MGANMARRLLKKGHECVVFDVSPKAVGELAHEGASGATSLSDLVKKLAKPRCRVADGPGCSCGPDHR
jgi:6-phosphogluconate dehydrogenase